MFDLASVRSAPLYCSFRFGALLQARRIDDGTDHGAISRRSDYWWLPEQLEAVERGRASLIDVDVLELCRLYEAPHLRTRPESWRVVSDRSHVDPTFPSKARTGSERLMAEVMGQGTHAATAEVVLRYLAMCAALGIAHQLHDRSEADEPDVVQMFAEACEVEVTDVIDARREVLRHRLGAVTLLSQDLICRLAVPAAGLLIAAARGATLVLMPTRQRVSWLASGEPALPPAGPLHRYAPHDVDHDVVIPEIRI